MSVWRWGPNLRVAHCCFEHADQISVPHRALGQPAAGRQGCEERDRWIQQTRWSRSTRPMRRSWRGSPRSTWPRIRAWVCARVPHQTQLGRRTTVWSVSARTNSIIALADQLAEQDIERVVLEATSDYYRPLYYLLEARGLTVWLVNARDVKNVPGRPKTDKLDAVWLAKLNERGMLRPSFVPPVEIRQLRDYTRLRVDLTAELEDALIKLSSVVTDMMGVSGRAMIAALIAGERDPRVLADLAKGRLRVKHTALIE